MVLPTSGPPGTCMCSPFSVIINCGGRGHGCWLLFPLLKLFWVFFAGPSCLSEIDVLRVARRTSLEFPTGADVGGFLKMPRFLVGWRITADQAELTGHIVMLSEERHIVILAKSSCS